MSNPDLSSWRSGLTQGADTSMFLLCTAVGSALYAVRPGQRALLGESGTIPPSSSCFPHFFIFIMSSLLHPRMHPCTSVCWSWDQFTVYRVIRYPAVTVCRCPRSLEHVEDQSNFNENTLRRVAISRDSIMYLRSVLSTGARGVLLLLLL